MKRLVYIIAFALGLPACYDDKDSYDYHDICEVNIEGVESVYETVYRESVLEIDPTVTVTEGNIGDPPVLLMNGGLTWLIIRQS